MESDDELDDGESSAPLLPPDDRLWRHPSELSIVGSCRAAGSSAPGMGSGWRPGDNRLWAVAVLAGAIGALLATGVGYAVGGHHTRTVAVPAVERDLLSPVATLAAVGQSSGFVSGAQLVRPSCVVLVAHDAHGTRASAGFVFRSDGMVLTIAHTVLGAHAITATVRGSRQVVARLVASDPGSDLAVLKLDGSGYDPAPLGSALDLRVGDPVMALRPMGSANDDVPGDQGSVRDLGRDVPGVGGQRLSDLLQVDTTEPPSTVGAPLLDNHGAVIGITTALGDPGKAVAYATPVDLARQVEEQLLRTGRVVPVWLGVEGVDLTAEAAKSLGVDGGALVRRAYPNSPAAAAGLRGGDLVLGVDGRVVTSMANLITALHARPPGTQVSLEVHRNGADMTMTAQLQPRPPGVT